MRTTDFCFPLLRLRAPAPRQLPASLRDLRLALGARACTRDQETGGPGVSRRPIRFGGPARVGNDGVNSSVCARSNRTSDTPVAPAPPRRTFVRRLGPGRRGRARRSSVKIERAPRPRVPSIDEGHSRACANRCRPRKRSRDASASIRPSAPFRPQLLAPRFMAETRSYYELDSRPRSPRTPRVRDYGGRFTEPGCRPSTSATTFTTREHALERPALAFPPKAVNVSLPLGAALACATLV